jgi:hypothetical protein
MENLALGWRVDELVRGELDRGASVSATSGKVLRPQVPAFLDLAPRAAELLQQLEREQIHLPGAMPGTLAFVAAGMYEGKRYTAEAVLREAESAVNAAKVAREQAAAKQAALKRIRVIVPFRSSAGNWRAGEHLLSEEELDDLLAWQDKAEAFARLRGWEQPDGYPVWPPFELEGVRDAV